MFELSEQHTEQQARKEVLKSYLLSSKEQQEKQSLTQESVLDTLENSLKSSKQSTLDHSMKIYERLPCRYNSRTNVQFLCCSRHCDNHSFICTEQTCECASNHQRCTTISIKPFLNQILSKLSKPIPKQIELYFQVKSIIYQYMVNRISQERQALRDWQQDIGNASGKSLFLYGFNKQQAIVCHAPKVFYQQQLSTDHQKCGCLPLKISQKNIQPSQLKTIQELCSKIHKKYSSIINHLDQKIVKLQYHKECANLNPAQFIFLDFIKNKNESFDLKDMDIVPGSAIYKTRKYIKKDQQIDLKRFSLNRMRNIWKSYTENLFRLYVEGKAMNELFYELKKLEQLKTQSAQQLITYMDIIVQSLSHGLQYLFNKSLLKKTKYFKNIDPTQLKTKLKKYNGMHYDEVYIISDRYITAINDIQVIQELSKLKNVTKLEIKWCCQMKVQLWIQIVEKMPHLKSLALLGHCKKLANNFIKKLCSLRELTQFYINYYSRNDFYRSYNEDTLFITLYDLNEDSLPSVGELLQLSTLPRLENLEITRPNDPNSAQIIKNIKAVRNLTLGHNCVNNEYVNFDLMKEVYELKFLKNLTLIGVNITNQQVDHIITNNPHLTTIIIKKSSYNECINDGTIALMANLIHLQNLCVNMNKSITGVHLSKLSSLKMLELQNCNKICRTDMIEALTKMHKLEHLALNNNGWVNDEVITAVQSCDQLVYLNINRTSVSGEGIKYLKGLNRLNILICGYTRINGHDLIELTKSLRNITRLSIQNLQVNESQLLQINANCQAITHIDVRETKIKMDALLKFKHLKVFKRQLELRYTYDYY